MCEVTREPISVAMRRNFTDCLENVRTTCGLFLDEKQYPLMIGLGITNRCNLDCPFCFYHDVASNRDAHEDMSIKFIEDLFASLGKLFLVNMALQGEPFLHPEITDILKIVSLSANKIVVCTNGLLISEKHCLALEKLSGLKLILSVDATDAATYSLMRKGGSFKLFQQNAIKMRECLGENIELAAVVCRNNLESLKKLPEFAKSLGIKKVNLSPLCETGFTKYNKIYPASKPSLAELLIQIDISSKEHGCSIQFADPAVYKKECTMPFFYTSILTDGSIFPCCGDFEPEKILKYDFNGIFNHPYLTSIRENLARGRRMIACAHCFQ